MSITFFGDIFVREGAEGQQWVEKGHEATQKKKRRPSHLLSILHECVRVVGATTGRPLPQKAC